MKTTRQDDLPSVDDLRAAEDVQRVALPLDAESRRMLDELVMWLYPGSVGTQRNKQRGRVVEIAIRILYQRTITESAASRQSLAG